MVALFLSYLQGQRAGISALGRCGQAPVQSTCEGEARLGTASHKPTPARPQLPHHEPQGLGPDAF